MRFAKHPEFTPEGRSREHEARLTSRDYRHQSAAWFDTWAADKRDARVLGPVESDVEFVGVVRRRKASA